MAKWMAKWNKAVDLLQEVADETRMGYQIIVLETKDSHHEEVAVQILPDPIQEYDPEKGLYADGAES